MYKYGLAVEQLSKACGGAVEAAERHRSRTIVYRNRTAVAAIVPIQDIELLDPPDPGAGGTDPLLSLCGACRDDMFVDGMISDFGKTLLFRHD